MKAPKHGSRNTVRWTGMHRDKQSFRWRWQAQLYAWRIRYYGKPRPGGWPVPYSCRWGQWYRDGEIFPKHWHVGRKPTRIR